MSSLSVPIKSKRRYILQELSTVSVEIESCPCLLLDSFIFCVLLDTRVRLAVLHTNRIFGHLFARHLIAGVSLWMYVYEECTGESKEHQQFYFTWPLASANCDIQIIARDRTVIYYVPSPSAKENYPERPEQVSPAQNAYLGVRKHSCT